MNAVQDHGVRWHVGHHRRWPRLGALGERHARLEVGPIGLGHPLRRTAHGSRLARQGGPQFFADRSRACRRRRTAGVRQQGGHHRLGATLVRGDGVEACDDGRLLRGALWPLAQAHGRRRGRRLPHRHAFAVRLHHQDRPDGR